MSSNLEYTSLFSLPVAALQYQDISRAAIPAEDGEGDHRGTHKENRKRAEVEMSEAEFAARIRHERLDAAVHIEQSLRQEYEQKLAAARTPVAKSIETFVKQRDDYFARVEAEVVQLSLSIAAKILHREAQVDPMLIAAVVRIAVEKMRDDSTVKIHVGKGCAAAWKNHCSGVASMMKLEIIEDPELTDHDCMLETELGIANFGLDAQLKEVEQGFFDLLALRPASR